MTEPRKRILCICKPGAILSQQVHALENAGYAVEPVVGVRQAVQAAAAHPVDLIIIGAAYTDDERRRLMKRLDPQARIPMLAMRPQPQDASKALHPVNETDNLLATVHSLLADRPAAV